MKHSDKRAEIMHVALELLAEQGFHRVPMSMIARKAKVAVGTIYLYFESKDELITELFLQLDQKINAGLRKGFPEGRPIREQFLHAAKRIFRYCIDNPLEYRYLEQYMNSPYGISMRRDRLSTGHDHDHFFLRLFGEAIAHQVVKDLPVVVLFSLSVGPLIVLARDHILGFVNMNDHALIDEVAEACWDAIRR